MTMKINYFNITYQWHARTHIYICQSHGISIDRPPPPLPGASEEYYYNPHSTNDYETFVQIPFDQLSQPMI